MCVALKAYLQCMDIKGIVFTHEGKKQSQAILPTPTLKFQLYLFPLIPHSVFQSLKHLVLCKGCAANLFIFNTKYRELGHYYRHKTVGNVP
jgi:hypothetical protein